jgi:hypothetical protein
VREGVGFGPWVGFFFFGLVRCGPVDEPLQGLGRQELAELSLLRDISGNGK